MVKKKNTYYRQKSKDEIEEAIEKHKKNKINTHTCIPTHSSKLYRKIE